MLRRRGLRRGAVQRKVVRHEKPVGLRARMTFCYGEYSRKFRRRPPRGRFERVHTKPVHCSAGEILNVGVMLAKQSQLGSDPIIHSRPA